MALQEPKQRIRRTQPSKRTQPTGRVKKQPNHALGYVRVSTEEQARLGVSIDAQAERIKAYFTVANLEPAGLVIDDGVSGSKRFDSRPGGADLNQALAEGRAGHVVTVKLDRLFRNAEDALRQTREWDRAGIILHIIDMGGATINTSSATGKMLLTMMAAFAEMERNLGVERTTSALQHKKRHHQAYSPTPYGFDREGDQLVPNVAEAAVVAQIKCLRSEGQGLRAIADLLNSTNIPTKNGRHWHASTIANILGNSIHTEESN